MGLSSGGTPRGTRRGNEQEHDSLRPRHAEPEIGQEDGEEGPARGRGESAPAHHQPRVPPTAAEACEAAVKLRELRWSHGRFTHFRPNHSPNINRTTSPNASQVFQSGMTSTLVSVFAVRRASSGSLETVVRS